MKSEKQIHLYSLWITILIHIVLLIIPLRNHIQKISKETIPDPIPVQYIVKKTIIKKSKPIPPPKKEIKIKKKTPSPKPEPKPPQPTSLPGDRKFAEVSKSIAPFYPKDAINNLYEGTIILDVTVDESGQIKRINIKRSSGYDILDQAFINSVKNDYQFKSKRVMGENKTDTITLKYTFEL